MVTDELVGVGQTALCCRGINSWKLPNFDCCSKKGQEEATAAMFPFEACVRLWLEIVCK